MDGDGDGVAPPEDCDDARADVHPGALDLPGDTLDADCMGGAACSPSATWRNHGAFVRCVAQVAGSLLSAGQITFEQADSLVHDAARSDVGKPPRGRRAPKVPTEP